jgi:FkbM family methyltransferase
LDVGANVGYYTLLSARRVGPTGRVVAFEPHAANVLALRRHLDLNMVANVDVLEAAVSNREGTEMFEAGHPAMGRLSKEGSVPVRTVTLDAVWPGLSRSPDVLKIDVEGEEAEVLDGGHRMLSEVLPVIFLATHGREPRVASHAMLKSLGYRLFPIDGRPVERSSEIVARHPQEPAARRG